MSSKDGHLTETCKCNKYLQIKSHWTVNIYSITNLIVLESNIRDGYKNVPIIRLRKERITIKGY
jgi:hypothetical protein